MLGEGAGGSSDVRDAEGGTVKNTVFKTDQGGRSRDEVWEEARPREKAR